MWLPVPDPDWILAGHILYPKALNALVEARSTLTEALTDLAFMENTLNTRGVTEEDYREALLGARR